jgi:hypothetical protein
MSPVPMIGASGAISALVGAYAMLLRPARGSASGPKWRAGCTCAGWRRHGSRSSCCLGSFAFQGAWRSRRRRISAGSSPVSRWPSPLLRVALPQGLSRLRPPASPGLGRDRAAGADGRRHSASRHRRPSAARHRARPFRRWHNPDRNRPRRAFERSSKSSVRGSLTRPPNTIGHASLPPHALQCNTAFPAASAGGAALSARTARAARALAARCSSVACLHHLERIEALALDDRIEIRGLRHRDVDAGDIEIEHLPGRRRPERPTRPPGSAGEPGLITCVNDIGAAACRGLSSGSTFTVALAYSNRRSA